MGLYPLRSSSATPRFFLRPKHLIQLFLHNNKPLLQEDYETEQI
jgi:hypothetical protein